MSSANEKIRKDTLSTIIIGPVKFIVPTASFMLLYPIILSRFSIEVVGVWSLFATVVSFISVADIGFSQLLTRDAALDQDHCSIEVINDYTAAQRTYYFVLFVLVALFFVLQDNLLKLIGNYYPTQALVLSILLLLVGAIMQLVGKLDAAILAAWHENVTIQLTTAIAPLFMYGIALIGAWCRKPIEGMALGTLISGLTTIVMLRYKMSKVQPSWRSNQSKIDLYDSLQRLPRLLCRGWYLYSTSIGLLIRGPIYRFIIASFLGLPAVATFDVAMRVTQTVREILASGFSVLYPTFASYYRSKDQQKIIQLIRVSLLILLGGGTFMIGVLIVGAELFLKLWLGAVPVNALNAIRILGFWQVITLLNVPFWYLLQATHLERSAAFSIWAHTILIIALIPLGKFVYFTLDSMLLYWTLSSILTQISIYYFIESRLNCFLCVFRSTRLVLLLILSSMFIVCCLWIFNLNEPALLVFSVSIYAFVISILLFESFKVYWAEAAAVP